MPASVRCSLKLDLSGLQPGWLSGKRLGCEVDPCPELNFLWDWLFSSHTGSTLFGGGRLLLHCGFTKVKLLLLNSDSHTF